MPTFDLDENHAIYQVRAFKPGVIQINEKIFTQSMIISPRQVTEWMPQTIEELTSASLSVILTFHPDILLIGTGSQHVFLAVEIYGDLINQNIGVEIMDTRAACRTYNALSSENRNVVAALIIK